MFNLPAPRKEWFLVSVVLGRAVCVVAAELLGQLRKNSIPFLKRSSQLCFEQIFENSSLEMGKLLVFLRFEYVSVYYCLSHWTPSSTLLSASSNPAS